MHGTLEFGVSRAKTTYHIHVVADVAYMICTVPVLVSKAYHEYTIPLQVYRV